MDVRACSADFSDTACNGLLSGNILAADICCHACTNSGDWRYRDNPVLYVSVRLSVTVYPSQQAYLLPQSAYGCFAADQCENQLCKYLYGNRLSHAAACYRCIVLRLFTASQPG